LRHEDLEELLWGTLRWFDPAVYGECQQEGRMRSQKGHGEWFRQKSLLGHELPIDRLLVEERSDELERLAKVGVPRDQDVMEGARIAGFLKVKRRCSHFAFTTSYFPSIVRSHLRWAIIRPSVHWRVVGLASWMLRCVVKCIDSAMKLVVCTVLLSPHKPTSSRKELGGLCWVAMTFMASI